LLTVVTKASPGNDAPFRKAVTQYISYRRQLIQVSRTQTGEGKQVEWLQSNDVIVDDRRVPVVAEFELEGERAADQSSLLHLSFRGALFRAWTFSVLDYIESPKQWKEMFLYNRSIPLYGFLITILLVGFGTIRAFYRDQEGRELEVELEQLEKQHSEEITLFQQQVNYTKEQCEEAIRNRDQLVEEIAGIDREYQILVKNIPLLMRMIHVLSKQRIRRARSNVHWQAIM